jgi:glycine cleavage system transcriptional repressor
MGHLAVTAVGADRPGIVAAVTSVLVERGCNLEDTSMSILRGHFAMVLIVAAPDAVAATDLEAELAQGTAELDLVVSVREIADVEASSAAGESWTVTVYGADRPGIVHRITQVLADLGVNVVDLTTRVASPDDHPVYAMLLEVTLPVGLDGATLADRLDAAAGSLGVECSLHPSDADIL